MGPGWSLLVDLVAVLAGAFMLGMLMERVRQSAVVGYILAGLILGPGLLRVVREVDAVRALAEIGVALLLFTIGLEFSWKRLSRLGRVALGGGVLQIGLTMLATAATCLAFGFDWRGALVVGAVVAMSSTTVVLKALKERGDLDAPHGKASLGILLFQDIAVIPLVVIATLIGPAAKPEAPWREIGPMAIQIVLGIVGIAVTAGLFVPRLLRSRAMARNRELPVLMAVTTCIGAAWGAHSVGISPSVGAFVAGMVLAGTVYADQIRVDVTPLRTLFATLFFASIGMLADVRMWAGSALAVASLTLAVMLGKALLAGVSVRLFGLTTISSIATGLCLAQIGELSFVLSELGTTSGLIEPALGQLLTSTIVLSMIACPYLVSVAPKLSRSLAKRLLPARVLYREKRIEAARAPTYRNHAIVVGFGEAGRTAAAKLAESGVTVLVIETDRRLVRAAREAGYSAMFGDATHAEILESANVGCSVGLVVALSDHVSARYVTSQARRVMPDLPIVARARYHLFVEEIVSAGADRVVDEETSVGARLGEEMLLQLGLRWDELGEGLHHPELRQEA